MTSPNEKAARGKGGDLEVFSYPLDDSILAQIKAGTLKAPAPRYSKHWPDSPLIWSPLPEELPTPWYRAALEYGDAGAHQRRHDFNIIRLDHCAKSYDEGYQDGYTAGMLEANEEIAELQRQAAAVNRANLRLTGGRSFAQICDLRGEPERAAKARQIMQERGL